MITKEQFIQSLVHELEIIKHLAEKIDATKLDYRPTAKQRSTLELLKYMGQMISTGIKAHIAGSEAMYMELAKSQEGITFENFLQKVDEQIAVVKNDVGALTEEDFGKVATIWGNTAPLSARLLGTLKNASAYKMQLFLYMKSCGNESIGTSNLWAGMDLPPKE
jgi:hypothetical protein